MQEHQQAADRFAPLFVFTAGVLWGSMGLFVRSLGDAGLSSAEIAQLRCIVTALVLFVYIFIMDRPLLRIRLRDIWCFVGTGVLSIVFFNMCYFSTIERTSLSVAAVLLYTAPAFVIVLSAVFFGEKITGRKIISLVLTFAGCICVSGLLRSAGVMPGVSPADQAPVPASGMMTAGNVLVGIGAGVGYALYSIFSRFALERGYKSLTISLYTFAFAALGTCPFVSMEKIAGVFTSGWSMTAFVFLFGIVTTVFPYLFYTRGLEGVENGRAAIISSVEPVVATILGVLIFHEILHSDELAGIALILAAILISNVSERAS